MNIESIKDKFDSAKSYANMKTYVKKVNEALDLTPVTFLHEHEYVSRFEELCNKLIEKRQVRSKPQLIARLQFIVSLIAKFDPSKSQALRLKVLQMRNSPSVDFSATVTASDAAPWSEMLEMFKYEIDNNPRREAKVISVCFKHGYCLNLTDIFNTSTSVSYPDREHNVLDLGNLIWTISDKKTGSRVITVSQDFADEIKKYIEIPDFWLLYKSTGLPYRTCLLTSVGIDAFRAADVKYSYDAYQRDGSTEEPVELGCEPHPLHLENPDKFNVCGKAIIKARLKTPTMEVWE